VLQGLGLGEFVGKNHGNSVGIGIEIIGIIGD
jgi:hypothetical protein